MLINRRYFINIQLLLLISVISLISINALLTFYSLIVLYVSIKLVYRRNEPNVFTFLVVYHWLQISITVFYSSLINTPIVNILNLTDSAEDAILLSLTGLLFISLGIYLSLKSCFNRGNSLLELGKRYSVKKIFIVYVISFVIFWLLQSNMFAITGITQILIGLSSIKMIALYFLLVVAMIQRKKKLITIVFIFEILYGFTGYFSGFTTIFYVLLMAYFTINTKINVKKIITILPIITVFFSLVLMWTAIKPEYRNILNKNSDSQVVQIDVSERFESIINLAGSIDSEKLVLASNAIVSRLSYVQIFGQVIDFVPQGVDYEYGGLWLGSLVHILTPRILFPDKASLDDSVRTNKYTGKNYAGADKGTSIGIGYFAESYIDFGRYFMFIPLLLLGLLYGKIYKGLLSGGNTLLNYALIVTVFYGKHLFEIRNDKLIGGLIIILILALIMKKLFLFKIFNSKITLKNK
jgi:hypothetical protein